MKRNSLKHNRKPIIFVHIPKTGGTSFRKGCESIFSTDLILRDYSPTSPETNLEITDIVYNESDLWKMSQLVEKRKIRFITGHFNANKYAPLFGTTHLVTFLREPIQRIISEYKHYVRHNGFTGTFKDFYRQPVFINRQYNMVKNMPIPMFGFVGITENYESSLKLLNKKFKLKIPFLQMNSGEKQLEEQYTIEPDIESEIKNLNQLDIEFYQNTRTWLDLELEYAENKTPFVKGGYLAIYNKTLLGWASSVDKKELPEISISINNQFVNRVKACEYRQNLHALSAPRKGYLGFSTHLTNLKLGDVINAIVTKTEQPLFGFPFCYKP